MTEGSEQRTDDRIQKTKGRRRRAVGREQKTEGSEQWADNRGQRTEDRRQKKQVQISDCRLQITPPQFDYAIKNNALDGIIDPDEKNYWDIYSD